ncbi:hypothetical protein [Sebaldella sp. S0638]|uniref:hypothetical protein n=1 Tax=Sebaldella sp. S0638 TaxID=2957809 RepID=UPI00209E906C|nr:hypothetical protein [Sebaldella sp. S0638]MCP1226205.1 hypothetical protein [Sebaldella sp. S0638]
MDSALCLRLDYENNNNKIDNKILELLMTSTLVNKLTKNYIEHPLFAVFRIMGLSEIPYTENLRYTEKLINYINNKISTNEGFSCLGGISEIVPCYNAMLLEAYTRLGLSNTKECINALNWIKKYQLFGRNQKTTWKYFGICKHGGCLGKVPCYIGIGKTMRALITYAEFNNKKDIEVENLINNGIDYMLYHSIYKRLSNGYPISSHITDVMMPQSYVLSLTDLIYIVGKRKLTGVCKKVCKLNLI